MKTHITALFLVCLTACAASAGDPAAASRLTGHWLAASGNVEVEVAACDPAKGGTPLCGTITRVLSNQSMSGSGQSMGDRNDTGLRILTDFVPAGGDSFQGHLLNRETGKVYDCILRPGETDEMVVRPYVFVSLFGQTQIWHRRP
jgi:uncharacterized protein (DUF2147 family)